MYLEKWSAPFILPWDDVPTLKLLWFLLCTRTHILIVQIDQTLTKRCPSCFSLSPTKKWKEQTTTTKKNEAPSYDYLVTCYMQIPEIAFACILFSYLWVIIWNGKDLYVLACNLSCSPFLRQSPWQLCEDNPFLYPELTHVKRHSSGNQSFSETSTW